MGLMSDGWAWDPTLYAGSADHYERGRLPYPAQLAPALAEVMSLDGQGRLLDVGCGPGIVALRLAHLFREAVGIDADTDMVQVAVRRARELSIDNATFRVMRAEALPGDLGRFRVATFAQSFHWFDRDRVAVATLDMLEPGGAFVHVNATTGEGDECLETGDPLPPYGSLHPLIRSYLGSNRRAGQGTRTSSPSGEGEVLRAAGFLAPEVVQVSGGEVVHTTPEDILSRHLSLSSSAPHLFGARLEAFCSDALALLRAASRNGRFAERVRDAELVIYRKPGPYQAF